MTERILVTGALGQIGIELVPELQKLYEKDNVICLDIKTSESGYVEKVDVRNKESIKNLIEKYNITQIYHLASLLSATGEKYPDEAWDININGLKNILDLAKEYNIKVFWPSSIAVFGPTTPKNNTPQHTIIEPSTMYGITKFVGEMLCEYYFNKFGVDVRSLRFPGLISYKAEPGGGTTDYAVAIFYEAIKKGKYNCFVRENTVLPMMYMDDAIKATLMLMQVEKEKISIRTSYNLAAISFSAKELEEEIKKHIPELIVEYKPDYRQKIADSWPKSIDDLEARKDWDWKYEYDLSRMTKVMLEKLKEKLQK